MEVIANITAAWVVDREFVYIGGFMGLAWARFECLWAPWACPLGSLCPSWGTCELPLAPLGVPLGAHWSSFGLPLAVLGDMWDSFGVPLVVLGHLWDPFGVP
jgi:hypothetical protein